MRPEPLLRLEHICKRYGDFLALGGVDFDARPGEIHALLGENGAGKSTLMNTAAGLTQPSSGAIFVDGQPVHFASPDDAARAGVGMVHQHFVLVPQFSVLENLLLAAQKSGVLLDKRGVAERAQSIMARLTWNIPLSARVSGLPVGAQQRVEILRALVNDARILLFDEPTAVLAPPEVDGLLHVCRALRDEGHALVFVSHKLNEVLALCDRVSVLRRGLMAGTVDVVDTDAQDLARRMVGSQAEAPPALQFWGEETLQQGSVSHSPHRQVRNKENNAELPPPRIGGPGGPVPPALTLSHVGTAPDKTSVTLYDISLQLMPGEILGVAGVDGNGQRELFQLLTGQRAWAQGTLFITGQNVPRLRPSDLARLGIATVPPDRRQEGLALPLSVEDNLVLEASARPEFRWGPFLKRRALRRFAHQLAAEFDVRSESLQTPAFALSGGNQQKIVLARALERSPALLIVSQPTRGLDVAATAFVHGRLRQRQQEGGAIVLLSTELDEVLALSTHVAVLYGGRILDTVPPDTPREVLGLLMGGNVPLHRAAAWRRESVPDA